MRYGNCVPYTDVNKIKIVKETGFDYLETGLSALSEASDEEISEFISNLGEIKIKCEAVNVLFPGGISLTGENPDFAKAGDYIDKVFAKTKDIKFRTVVFGSGAARRFPEGFPKQKAEEQIIRVIRDYLLPAAEKYNFTVTLEPLCRDETNIVNKISEAEDIINKINHEKIRVLADLYHIGLENDFESLERISGMKNLIAHCHIANPYDNRYYPHESDSVKSIELYRKYFENLKLSGYDNRISIEGNIGSFSYNKNFSENIRIPEWVGEENRLFYAESKKSLEFIRGL